MAPSEEYGWVVDHANPEYFEDLTLPIYSTSRPDGIFELLTRGGGQEFKMYDDDGEFYYSGRYIGPDDDTMFTPLWNFGTPHGGATEIVYLTQGVWRTL